MATTAQEIALDIAAIQDRIAKLAPAVALNYPWATELNTWLNTRLAQYQQLQTQYVDPGFTGVQQRHSAEEFARQTGNRSPISDLQYDGRGQLTSYNNAGVTVTIGRDVTNRISTLTGSDGMIATVSYDGAGRVSGFQ